MQNIQREVNLLIFFTYVYGRSVCLICMQHISVVKEYSIGRHYVCHHSDIFINFSRECKDGQGNEIVLWFKEAAVHFNCSMEVSDVAVKASYLIAKKIVATCKPFSDRKSVKTFLLKAT